MNTDNIFVFLDPLQRTIIATQVSSDEKYVTVTKPVILQVSPTQDKKLQVQLYPLFFREFTFNRDEFANWTYSRDSIVNSDVKLEPNLIAQYKQMFQTAAQAAADSNKVVKLFDDSN
jgi:hypothetical protein